MTEWRHYLALYQLVPCTRSQYPTNIFGRDPASYNAYNLNLTTTDHRVVNRIIFEVGLTKLTQGWMLLGNTVQYFRKQVRSMSLFHHPIPSKLPEEILEKWKQKAVSEVFSTKARGGCSSGRDLPPNFTAAKKGSAVASQAQVLQA